MPQLPSPINDVPDGQVDSDLRSQLEPVCMTFPHHHDELAIGGQFCKISTLQVFDKIAWAADDAGQNVESYTGKSLPASIRSHV
jgi:hypothetical protein